MCTLGRIISNSLSIFTQSLGGWAAYIGDGGIAGVHFRFLPALCGGLGAILTYRGREGVGSSISHRVLIGAAQLGGIFGGMG